MYLRSMTRGVPNEDIVTGYEELNWAEELCVF